MSETPIDRFRRTIADAKEGDVEAIVTIRNVMREIADTAPRPELIRVAEKVCEVRDEFERHRFRVN